MSDLTDRLRRSRLALNDAIPLTLWNHVSAAMWQAADHIEDLERKLAALDAAHVPTPDSHGESVYCADDGFVWPCRTHRILHPEATP